MRKYIIGFLFGVLLTAAGSAYAGPIVQNVIGKEVQGSFPIKINGKKVEQPAIVLEGSGYLPVRIVGESLNLDVTFNPDSGIELNSKVVPSLSDTSTTQQSNNQDKLKEIQKQIDDEKKSLEDYKVLLEANERLLNDPQLPKEDTQKFVNMYKEYIEDTQSRIDDLEKQKLNIK